MGSLRYRVTFKGPGGHSYGAFGMVNPIHALGRAMAKIGDFQVPREPKTTFNVGRIGEDQLHEAARRRMVERQLARRGIADHGVLEAMGRVPREEFVRQLSRSSAYEDHPLPIAEGQTISQPYIVALTVEAAQVDETSRVLDVGTGSGYAAAVLAEIVENVVSIERHAALA